MMARAFSVLIVHNRPLQNAASDMLESDAGILEEVKAVQQSLDNLGYPNRVVGINSLAELNTCLLQSDEPVVVNLVEYLPENPQDASQVPTVCRAFGKSCTGSDSLALMLGLDKWRCKALLEQAGLHTPHGILIRADQEFHLDDLPAGPFIVKPVAQDASEGIDDSSIVQQPDQALREAMQRIYERFHQQALVEQFIEGRELNISLLQTGDRVAVLPLAEIDFSALTTRPHIVGYAAKWQADSFEYQHTQRLLPAPLSEDTAAQVRQTALTAWQALGCQDYARVDMRLANTGELYIIEVNPNPDISPDAGFTAALLCSGTTYERFVETIVENAWGRLTSGLRPKGFRPLRLVRPAIYKDRAAVLSMLERSGFFRDDEISLALEVFDDSLRLGDNSAYRSYVIEEQGLVLGWISYGVTPGAVATFDIYWLVIEPARKSTGLGTELLAFAEAQIRAVRGRLIVIETSSTELYYPTRQFYIKRGYTESARLPDFYAPGDDKVVYTKVIAQKCE